MGWNWALHFCQAYLQEQVRKVEGPSSSQLRDGTTSSLYDKQGLQFLILDRKQKGLDTAVAEKALAQMNSIQNSIGLHF